ncbi:MAG: serine hydroxymethyltransferase [Elusimicrobia bacterium RIFOXYA2_FULL_39_19]|nr:MAG: serine hydroxymethyltransferase [Elusimicrobia bacterium RIFOXYA2_FULL_39_19]
MSILKQKDPELYNAIHNEFKRQRDGLELIASENYTSMAVLEAQGSVLTNKYAEGYPQRRYYGGCDYVDVAESLAIERVKKIFGAEHANVQPHSGTQANMAVYFAVLNPGDTIMGMHLSHGGHLSHGHPTSFSGKYFHTVPIGIKKDTEQIDYKEVRKLAKKHKPHLIVAGSSSYSRIIDWQKYREIADEVGAYFLTDIAHYAGLVAAGIYPSPVPYADFVTFTTHKTLRGPRGGMILCKQKFAPLIDKIVFPGIQGGPLMHIISAKAVALLEVMQPEFKLYQIQILKNSRRMSQKLTQRGYRVVSGGTDCHMFVLDLRPLKLTGKEAEKTLDSVHITVNKNSIPYDPQKPFITSGIRIGTPAVTTRGMKEQEMDIIADLIDTALKNGKKPVKLGQVKEKVIALTKKFPLYPEMK